MFICRAGGTSCVWEVGGRALSRVPLLLQDDMASVRARKSQLDRVEEQLAQLQRCVCLAVLAVRAVRSTTARALGEWQL